jgi:class 3 adenylate cyclase
VADSRVDPAELEARGLYDPDSPDAADRLELIRYLFQLGATVEDLERAEGQLPGVASMLALRGRPYLTTSEVAARAGLPEELAERFYRAAGFADPGSESPVGTEEDVEALRTLRAGIELLGLEEMMQLVRVLGSSLARIADAMVSTFIVNVGLPSLDEDPSGLALARANAEGGAVLRAGGTAIDYLLRRHIEIAQRPLVLGGQETQPLTVGFVDLVGSTALAQQIPIGELGAMLTTFDQLASDLIVDGGGRLVKLIGDEAMFVVADPPAACEIALALAEQLAAHPQLPPARGALATGEILTRDGDYFGPVVNLAARAVKLADPGGVLVSAEMRDATDDYSFTPVGTQRLKGFDDPVELFRLDRAG